MNKKIITGAALLALAPIGVIGAYAGKGWMDSSVSGSGSRMPFMENFRGMRGGSGALAQFGSGLTTEQKALLQKAAQTHRTEMEAVRAFTGADKTGLENILKEEQSAVDKVRTEYRTKRTQYLRSKGITTLTDAEIAELDKIRDAMPHPFKDGMMDRRMGEGRGEGFGEGMNRGGKQGRGDREGGMRGMWQGRGRGNEAQQTQSAAAAAPTTTVAPDTVSGASGK